jgi:hypothetical protein
MKKTGVFLVFLAFLLWMGFSVSALDFSPSVGGGALFGYTFTRYSMKGGNVDSLQSMDRINYGAFLYFDAVYGEAAVLIQGGNSAYREVMTVTGASNVVDLGNSQGSGTELNLGFSLLGKYPFTVGEKIRWFPLLGLEYHIALLEWRSPEGGIVYDRSQGKLPEDQDKDGNPYPLSAWNALWIQAGAGFDYDITGPLYLRCECLFGFRLPTPYEIGALEMAKTMFSASELKLAGLTGTPAFKIGLGWRF